METKPIFILFLTILSETVSPISGYRILFPEILDKSSILPVDGRVPLSNSEKCNEGELLYPGDDLDDWICDCKPGYLYVTEKERCYKAFEQGPCKENFILVMPKSSFEPKCRKNECAKSGQVMYRKSCTTLGSPCRRRKGNTLEDGYVGVHEISHKIRCKFDSKKILMMHCNNGSKKKALGICPR